MKRGQFWYSDFMIGAVIMVFIGILFTSTIVRLYESNDKIDDLINNGVLISDYFMSQGYLASQWANSEGRIGFVSSGKVNNNLDTFKNLDYDTSKYLLGLSYDYIVYFEDKNGTIIDLDGDGLDEDDFIGFPGIESSGQISEIDTDYMVKIIRFIYYNGEIVKMVVVIWD